MNILVLTEKLTLLVEQMHLAHNVEDEKLFQHYHTLASQVGFELMEKVQQLFDEQDS